MFWEKTIRKCEIIPRGYGVSYLDPLCYKAVCHLYPLNVVIGISRNLWIKIRYFHVTNYKDLYQSVLCENKRLGDKIADLERKLEWMAERICTLNCD